MPKIKIMDKLSKGEMLLLDGGTGSELQRRGANVLKGATSRLKAWSATANIEFSEVVQQVHKDYLRVGADIIISNNFWTIPSRMNSIGLGDKWMEYAKAAGENAIIARNEENPESYVAGGIAAPTMQTLEDVPIPDIEHMGKKSFHKEYYDHAKLLSDIGVDLILAEYLGFIPDCVAAVDACAEVGLPVFLAVRHIGENGSMQYQDAIRSRETEETLYQLAEALVGHPVDAILLMCSNPEAISAGLPILKDAFNGPIGAYPNIGYNPTGPIENRSILTNQLPSDGEDILQTQNYSPSRLAEFAKDWKDLGAQIIGGCCATGPEHIMAMKSVVKS
ncbi:MAG: homocysteine S-methyltransferase family protein [SAR202 cluster bacterium]|jgi:S-methylmethionine-dependent homocysteine/selenocysteine methylase|nr:homocysteine S-methyltransferase family protein [SAR202 cluster bacterium]